MLMQLGFCNTNLIEFDLFFGDRITEKIVVMGGRREYDGGRGWIRWRT